MELDYLPGQAQASLRLRPIDARTGATITDFRLMVGDLDESWSIRVVDGAKHPRYVET